MPEKNESFNLVVVRWYTARIHAELARSALDAYDIGSVVDEAEPYIAIPAQKVALRVRDADVEAALGILGPQEQFSD